VKIIRYGLFIPQLLAHCALQISIEEADTVKALDALLEGFESDERYLGSLSSVIDAW
jgi:hypothetical protein